MRALRRDVSGTREWMRADPLVKIIYNELRRERGERVIPWAAGTGALDVFVRELERANFPLTRDEARCALEGLTQGGFVVLAEPGLGRDGSLTIVAMPSAAKGARAS